MPVSSLVDFDKIRASWGMTVSELPDDMLTSLDLAGKLKLRLAKLEIPYDAIIAAVEPPATPTEEQQNTLLRLQLYSTAYCALVVKGPVMLALPQRRTDGNFAYQRYGKEALTAAAAEVEEQEQGALDDLLEDLGMPAVAAYTVATAAVRTFDPVTG